MMKGKMAWIAALVLVLGVTVWALQIQADQWDKKTILTVGETIQIPGATLTPGKYVFRLMDSGANRHIVQVFNEDQDHILATILAIPNYRLRPSGHSEFGFWETPQGTPPALRSWFYPGDNFGQEFSYPKSEAVQLSALTHQEVPTLSEEDEAKLHQQIVATPTPPAEPQRQSREQEQRQPEERTAEPTTTAQATPSPTEYPKPPASSAEQRTPTPTKLPSTAGSLPLIGLLGVGSLGIASLFRGSGGPINSAGQCRTKPMRIVRS
jgi:hypothetical protein